jgi:patatin-like phospholipase/acyl hydrolase
MVSSHLLGDRFFRLNPRIPNFSKTDPSVFPALIKIANKTNLQPTVKFIEKNWNYNFRNTIWATTPQSSPKSKARQLASFLYYAVNALFE